MKQLFAGLDVHKKTIQVSVMDKDGVELLNKSIPNTPGVFLNHLGNFQKIQKWQ